MSAREVLAVAVLVWLVGAVVGWCAGWTGRGEQHRAWHAGVVYQLAQARAELAQARDELDDLHDWWQAQRVTAPASSVVHVHVAAPGLWAPPPVLATAQVLDALPVSPVGRVGS